MTRYSRSQWAQLLRPASRNQCWQQRSDSIQARHKIRFQRRSRNPITGQLTKRLNVRANALTIAQAKLNIISSSPLFNYHTTVAPHNAKSLKLRLYPSLLEPVNRDTSVAEKKRIAEATIDRLRQRSATWEFLLDAAVVSGKGSELLTSTRALLQLLPLTLLFANGPLRTLVSGNRMH